MNVSKETIDCTIVKRVFGDENAKCNDKWCFISSTHIPSAVKIKSLTVLIFVTQLDTRDSSVKSVAVGYVDGLVQDCSNSSALAMELLQSCTKPSIYSKPRKKKNIDITWYTMTS